MFSNGNRVLEMICKKINAYKSRRRFLICLISIVLIITILAFALFTSNSNKFPLDNARYFYSAVFQGFAALLALILTAVLITLQNINSQIYNTEERIYKILGNRFPTYTPGTIKEIKQYMEKLSLFHLEFIECVKKNSKLSPEKHESHVKQITAELNSMFAYLDYWEEHKSNLHHFFRLSTLSSMVVLFYSAAVMMFVGHDNVLCINHPFILFLGLPLVMTTIVIFVLYLLEIIKAWTIQPEDFWKNHKHES